LTDDENPKPEIRRPKEIRNPKSESDATSLRHFNRRDAKNAEKRRKTGATGRLRVFRLQSFASAINLRFVRPKSHAKWLQFLEPRNTAQFPFFFGVFRVFRGFT
jgi:hypothetical protein